MCMLLFRIEFTRGVNSCSRMYILGIVVIKFNHTGCGVDGVLIDDRQILCVVYVPGAVLEPMQAILLILHYLKHKPIIRGMAAVNGSMKH